MFDKILGNLDLGSLLGSIGNVDEIATKLGLPADQVQNILQSFTGKMGQGSDQMTALFEAAQEHGFSVDKLQEIFKNFGQGETDNPIGDLANLFGKGFLGGKE